jgi:hypothetical protein
MQEGLLTADSSAALRNDKPKDSGGENDKYKDRRRQEQPQVLRLRSDDNKVQARQQEMAAAVDRV